MYVCVCVLMCVHFEKSENLHLKGMGAGFLDLPCRQGRNGELQCWNLRVVLLKAFPNSWEAEVSRSLSIYSRLALRRVEETSSQVSLFEEELWSVNDFKVMEEQAG